MESANCRVPAGCFDETKTVIIDASSDHADAVDGSVIQQDAVNLLLAKIMSCLSVMSRTRRLLKQPR